MTDPLAALAAIPQGSPTPVRPEQPLTTAQIDRVAREFEAAFAAQMLKPMFAGLKSDGMFSGGFAEDTWRGFLVEAMGKQIAETGGLGIADAVRDSLSRTAGE